MDPLLPPPSPVILSFEQDSQGEPTQSLGKNSKPQDHQVSMNQPLVDSDLPISKKLGAPVITLNQISKHYPVSKSSETTIALKNINLLPNTELFPILQGEFVMLRGRSGCGKTTLLNIIGTIDKPTDGELTILDTKITRKTKDSFLSDVRLEKIGFVFQSFNLLATLSAYENVLLPMEILGKLGPKERADRAKLLLHQVGLGFRMGHLPSELSGGEQQRCTIARALANDPELLLLDEPVGDLDTAKTISIMNILLDLNLQGKTMIMVTHDSDLECYADRVLYIKDGVISGQALNKQQTRLELGDYLDYLADLEKDDIPDM